MAEWIPNMCNEKSGFLFSHRCDRIQRDSCTRCQRPICEDHSHPEYGGDGLLCTTCTKKRKSREATAEASQGTQSRRRRYHDDDPYFYGSHYGGYWMGASMFSSYGHRQHYHDRNDFTDADSESLHTAGDAEFESDMMES